MPSINKISIDGGTTLYDIEDTTARQLIDDTVGWESVNIINEVHNGIMNQSGSYTGANNRVTNATSNTSSKIWAKKGTYILSCAELDNCSVLTKNNSGVVVDEFASVWNDLPFTFTLTEDAWFYFTAKKSDNSNIDPTTVHVMAIKSIYKDIVTGYVPYHASVDETKADNTVIAPVENGTTVQNPSGYAVGSHAIRNGAFITWKNAKAQGETIADSDYDSGDVADELDAKSYSTTGLSYTKCSYVAGGFTKLIGNLVLINIRILSSDDVTTEMDIDGFPAYSNIAYRHIVVGTCIKISDNSNESLCAYIRNDNGRLRMIGSITPNKEYAFSCVYLCN